MAINSFYGVFSHGYNILFGGRVFLVAVAMAMAIAIGMMIFSSPPKSGRYEICSGP